MEKYPHGMGGWRCSNCEFVSSYKEGTATHEYNVHGVPLPVIEPDWLSDFTSMSAPPDVFGHLTDHDFENMCRIVYDDRDMLSLVSCKRLIDEVRRLRVFEAAVRKLCEVDG